MGLLRLCLICLASGRGLVVDCVGKLYLVVDYFGGFCPSVVWLFIMSLIDVCCW